MEDIIRTTVTLDIETTDGDASQLLRVSQLLLQVDGVDRVDIKQTCKSIPSVTAEVQLVGADTSVLRNTYQRISKLASQSPLLLRGRTCTLSTMFD